MCYWFCYLDVMRRRSQDVCERQYKETLNGGGGRTSRYRTSSSTVLHDFSRDFQFFSTDAQTAPLDRQQWGIRQDGKYVKWIEEKTEEAWSILTVQQHSWNSSEKHCQNVIGNFISACHCHNVSIQCLSTKFVLMTQKTTYQADISLEFQTHI